jgi:predicted nucleic acid-binding protein
LDRIEADCESEGPIALIEFTGNRLVSAAEDLAFRHGLRALDAIHRATCLRRRGVDGQELACITPDNEQAAAARAEGLTVE